MGCFKRCCTFLGLSLPVLAAFLAQQACSFWPEWTSEMVKFDLRPPAPDDIDPCAPVGEDLGKDLTEKGYTIVRQVIGEAEAKALMDYANTLPYTNYFSGYRIPDVAKLVQLTPSLAPRLQILISEIQNGSSIDIAAPDGNLEDSFKSFEFLTANPDDPSKSVAHVWHQDFEAYYLSQSTDQYLNMYLVLEKSDPMEGGLTITPFDVMKQRCRGLHDVLLGNGATSWQEVEPSIHVIRNHQFYDRHYLQNFDPREISCSPRLVAGDLLILRGDTPHRTQTPVRAHRTTLSLRFSRFNFSAASMLEGGMVKYSRLRSSKDAFVAQAVSSESPEFLQAVQSGTAHLREWPELMSRFRTLHWQIEMGFWYRFYLTHVRRELGKWSGMDTLPWPILYY